MVVIIGIAVILLLLVVLGPSEQARPTRGWSGFVAGPSVINDDEARGAGTLRV